MSRSNSSPAGLTAPQGPGGAGTEAVCAGSVQTAPGRTPPGGGFLLRVDAPRTLPHGGDPLLHRQLPGLRQPGGRALFTPHPPLRGIKTSRVPEGKGAHRGPEFTSSLCCSVVIFVKFTEINELL